MNKKHYFWLIGLAVIFGVFSYYAGLKNFSWTDSITSNLAAGFLGSLVTAWLIDRSISNDKKKETEKICDIALTQLRPELLRHLGLLVSWYKAAVPQKPDNVPATISEIFNEDFYCQLRFLDFSKDAPVFPQMNWFAYTMGELETFRTKISQVVDKYAFFLDSTSLELLENLAHSNLVNVLIASARSHPHVQVIDKKLGHDRTYNILDMRDVKGNPSGLVREHVNKFEAFLEYYNLVSSKPISINDLGLWQENTAPKFGSGRLDELDIEE